MKIHSVNYSAASHQPFLIKQKKTLPQHYLPYTSDRAFLNKQKVSFGANPLNAIKEIKNIVKFIKAKATADNLYRYVEESGRANDFLLRNFCMEPLEGLQYGIKVFKGLTMKEIQYLSENLHVIAVKRGCKNMCSHCYADAKPQKREMSWEDFTSITKGFKTIRKRLHNLDIFGKNNQISRDDLIAQTTEFFYDADCMETVIKDKKGNLYDFTDLTNEVFDALGRKTAFGTSGWNKNNTLLQQRAEKYARYFAQPENMEKLNAFNVSLNVFNASYVASVKALKNGDIEKAKRLRQRYVDNMANTIFTFTPVLTHPKFNLLVRCFDSKAQNAKGFDKKALASLVQDIYNKLKRMYTDDLIGEQKYVKNSEHLDSLLVYAFLKLNSLDTALNSSGRMKKFMKEFNIKAPLLEYEDSMRAVKEDLKQNGRYHRYIMYRLIDADGKVYHMNYARFIPTEIQLNISGKDKPSPELANMTKDFVITKELLNRPENPIIKKVSVTKKK